jgi:hypothetical protein
LLLGDGGEVLVVEIIGSDADALWESGFGDVLDGDGCDLNWYNEGGLCGDVLDGDRCDLNWYNEGGLCGDVLDGDGYDLNWYNEGGLCGDVLDGDGYDMNWWNEGGLCGDVSLTKTDEEELSMGLELLLNSIVVDIEGDFEVELEVV